MSDRNRKLQAIIRNVAALEESYIKGGILASVRALQEMPAGSTVESAMMVLAQLAPEVGSLEIRNHRVVKAARRRAAEKILADIEEIEDTQAIH